jgi:hydroxypyruvate reductase
VARASSAEAVLQHLPDKPKGRCIVVGAGKASAAMAAALDSAWPDVDLSGVVVTRYGHAVPAGRIRIMEAAHPGQTLRVNRRRVQSLKLYVA